MPTATLPRSTAGELAFAEDLHVAQVRIARPTDKLEEVVASRLVERLEALGAPRVEPENPFWRDKSVTFEDPDGWRVVICAVTGV